MLLLLSYDATYEYIIMYTVLILFLTILISVDIHDIMFLFIIYL